MGMRLRAGAMGIPFMPIRPMLGSDVLKERPEAKEFDCPFTGEKLLLVECGTKVKILDASNSALGCKVRILGGQFVGEQAFALRAHLAGLP